MSGEQSNTPHSGSGSSFPLRVLRSQSLRREFQTRALPTFGLLQLIRGPVVDSKEMSGRSSEAGPRWWSEWGIAACLFFGTAAVVVWQNSRLGVLWDLSYILENAFRISAGDVPYRDFPFPYAPLTFLVQAALK